MEGRRARSGQARRQVTSTDVFQNIEHFTTSLTGTTTTRPTAYDYSFAQGAPGAGSAVITTNARRKTDRNYHTNASYRFYGEQWKFDVGGSFSHAQNTYRDTDFGFFSAALLRVRNLTLRYQGINRAESRARSRPQPPPRPAHRLICIQSSSIRCKPPAAVRNPAPIR
jgi:hypothetical protein